MRRSRSGPARPGPRAVALATVAGTAGLAVLLLAACRACGDAEVRGCLLRATCWVLVGGGVAGTSLAGAGRSGGWLVLLGLQPIWIAYALATAQPGFVFGSLAYAAGQLNGYLTSRRPGGTRGVRPGRGATEVPAVPELR
jgi:hypothetical protein